MKTPRTWAAGGLGRLMGLLNDPIDSSVDPTYPRLLKPRQERRQGSSPDVEGGPERRESNVVDLPPEIQRPFSQVRLRVARVLREKTRQSGYPKHAAARQAGVGEAQHQLQGLFRVFCRLLGVVLHLCVEAPSHPGLWPSCVRFKERVGELVELRGLPLGLED